MKKGEIKMDRYEEALERAKKGLPIDEVFPELKEQKPIEWSEGDEMMLDVIIYDVITLHNAKNLDELRDKINFLKSLRPQPKQEREPMKIKFRGKIYQVHSVRATPGGVPGYIIEDELGGYVCITNPEEV